MAGPAALAGRATLDFCGAQARARRRTTWLLVSFALAVLGVVALVYAALLVVAGLLAPGVAVVVGVEAGAGVARFGLFQPMLLLGAAAGVAAVTGLGSAYHAIRLAAGGGEAVARMLGGTPVDRGTADPAERRLVNVVEEMAIAAGLPVPQLYVLQREEGINAFAAGYTPGHSVVAVTRGALDRLTRDQLQGVVAHELSHLLNADTRIDLQLMAAVGGLTCLALLGRLVLQNAPGSSRSRDRGRGGLVLIGLGLLVAGGFGALCGKLVRYAVARQREWLADASAVQFTRNPEGLAGALRQIAREGSAVDSPHAAEAAHLFFASHSASFFSQLFSTHPPIEERIRRLAPHAAESGRPRPAPAAGGPGMGFTPAGVAGAAPGRLAAAGSPLRVYARPEVEHVTLAAGLLQRLPASLAAAARQPLGAQAIACGLLLDPAPAVSAQQLARLGGGDPRGRAEVERLAPAVGAVPRSDRLALLGLALPALDGLSPAQRQRLAADLGALAAADGRLTLFELAVQRVVLRRLSRDSGAPPRVQLRMLDEALPECLELLCHLAWIGGRDAPAAQAALDAGARVLGAGRPWRLLPRDRLDLRRLDATLTRLDQATPTVKERILGASVATALADARVTLEEAELLRAISAALGLALPPVVAGGPRAGVG